MIIALDTEFMEDGELLTLLSIGLVRADGEALYLENASVYLGKASAWVKTHVIPHLHTCPDDAHACPISIPSIPCDQRPTRWHEHDDMQGKIVRFCGEAPEFWGYYCAYDWVILCQLFGGMLSLPPGWPRYCRDLRQALDAKGFQHLIQPDEMPHHALSDARWILETLSACALQGDADAD